MKYDREALIRRAGAGEALTFIPFWGAHSEPGGVTRACLSQWYDCRFEVDGARYHTAEQYMMARKAALFKDEEILKQILASDDPAEIKALGRKVRGFEAAAWDAVKYDIVLRGNLAKFGQNTELWEYLDGTGDSVLLEASPYDGVWGVRLAADDPRVEDPALWRGENLLGFALMECRDRLRMERRRVTGGANRPVELLPLMQSNVYSLKGRVLIVGSCLPQVEPEAFARLAAGADQVYTLCLEQTHVNMAVAKLCAVFGTGQLEAMTFASVDRSPHCTQLHYIKHEIERLLPEHVPVENCVVSAGEIVSVPDAAIEMSKSLARLARMV